MKKFRKKFGYLTNNDIFIKTFWIAVETIVSAFVGALIAFVFGENYIAALIAFISIMAFLIIICAILLILENKVSVLSIMKRGLKERKYEDVIKFGISMSPTLFSSNKNEDRVLLGTKIQEAVEGIKQGQKKFNSGNIDYVIAMDGRDEPLSVIEITLLLDDLGWSLHLCNENEKAIANIVRGIKLASSKAKEIIAQQTNEVLTKGAIKLIKPYVKLMMRGYRHLSGIYYADRDHYTYSLYYENAARIILSVGLILECGGICEKRINDNGICRAGIYCEKSAHEKTKCVYDNIKNIYFNFGQDFNLSQISDEKIYDFLGDRVQGQLDIYDIKEATHIFNKLPADVKDSIVREQCYAWGRNIVKRLTNNRNNFDFLPDEELRCKSAEARALAYAYYYGAIDDFNVDISNKISVLGKKELRYLSLINEIAFIDLYTPIPNVKENFEHSGMIDDLHKIENLIKELERVCAQCRDKRGDLYIRNSLHLMEAYLIEFNLKYRYRIDSAKNNYSDLLVCQKKIANVYSDLKNYESQASEEIYATYGQISAEICVIKKELKNRRKTIKGKKRIKYEERDMILVEKILNGSKDKYLTHDALEHIKRQVFDFDLDQEHQKRISDIKTVWGVK
ncbi:MAG: hypothetical protein K2J01_04485 [Clostridiales bacterium]|nr:hypothetical protein [Clostridiales bacterium]